MIMSLFSNPTSSTDKNESSKSKAERTFFNWLDEILNKGLSDDVKAINFNLYEDGDNKWSIELVGTASFDEEDYDWACDEIYTTRENPFSITEESDWQTIENLFISFLEKYLKTGNCSDILKNYIAIAIGFVDGDLSILYKKEEKI